MKQCRFSCARWLLHGIVGEGQSAAHGASAAVLVAVLMVPDPTSGYQGGEHNHSAGAGLPPLYPRGGVVCAYSPAEGAQQLNSITVPETWEGEGRLC